MSNRKVGFGTRVAYLMLTGGCRAVGLLPAWFLYNPLAWSLYFLLYRVFRYRIKVVRSNLEGSFPEKTKAELRDIERKFYRHLAELFIDTMDLSGISEKQMRRRIEFRDVAEHEREVAGTDWIAALAHYGSWEYFSAYQLHTSSQVAGVYKALHSKAMGAYYNKMRSRFGLLPVDRKNLLRYIISAMHDPQRNFAAGLISDQYARDEGRHLWFDFLNRKTLFFSGIEKLAVKFGLPVYYMDVAKEGKARYSARFIKIYDGAEKLPEGEIVRRYAGELEKTIRRDPPYWLWSHKRWKYRREESTTE